MMKRLKIINIILFFSSTVLGQQISIAGQWRFAIDRDDKGIEEQWFNKRLPETIPASRLHGSKLKRR